MREFFKGWRRKVGVVMLLMACAVLSAWVRSLRVAEEAHFLYSAQTCLYFGEGRGVIHCGRSLANVPNYFVQQTFGWASNPLPPEQDFAFNRFRWSVRGGGFGIGFYNDLPPQLDENIIVTLPHWAIILPLTLLSGWLLLSRPRTKSTLLQPSESP